MEKSKLIVNAKKTFLIVAIMAGASFWFEQNYRILWNKQWELAFSCDYYRFALATLTPPEIIERGDIVTFENERVKELLDPEVWGQYKLYKQVVAVGGDHIRVHGNNVFINGEYYADRPLLKRLVDLKKPQFTEDFEITLAEDELFMMGFRKDKSFDSRYWGPIKTTDVIGEVLYRMLEG